MLVPHSEKRTLHFQLSLFAMVILMLIVFALFTGFFWFSLDFSGKEALLAARSRDLVETEASLDIIRDEVGTLVNSAANFQSSLDQTVDILGLREAAADPATAGGGDLSSLFTFEQSPGDTMAEVGDLKALRAALDDSVVRLEDMGLVLSSQKNLLSDIPNGMALKRCAGGGYSGVRSLHSSLLFDVVPAPGARFGLLSWNSHRGHRQRHRCKEGQ